MVWVVVWVYVSCYGLLCCRIVDLVIGWMFCLGLLVGCCIYWLLCVLLFDCVYWFVLIIGVLIYGWLVRLLYYLLCFRYVGTFGMFNSAVI